MNKKLFTSVFLFSFLIMMTHLNLNHMNVYRKDLALSREDFEAYPVGYSLMDADRWSGVRNTVSQSFTMNSTHVGHYIESSISAGWDDLSYQFSDPSIANPTGLNVSFMYQPISATPTYDLFALQQSTTNKLYLAQVSGNLCAANSMTPVVLLAITFGTWYNVTIIIVSTTKFDVDVDGTLYTNGGAHFNNAGGAWSAGISNFGIVQSTVNVAATWEFYIDNILPSWHNETAIPINIIGNTEMGLFPNKTGAGTLGNPYIIEDLVINATDIYCGIYLRGITVYLEIINCTISNVRNLYALDAGIRVAYSEHVFIINCTIINASKAVSVFASDSMVLSNLYLDNASTDYGIGILNSTNISVDDIIIPANGGIGIGTYVDFSYSIDVSNVNATNHSVGIEILNSNATAFNNTLNGSVTTGIYAQDSNVLIYDNNVTNGDFGIRVFTCIANLSSNYIAHSHEEGIIISGNSSSVENNTLVSNCEDELASIVITGYFNNITNNTVITDVDGFGISLDHAYHCNVSLNTIFYYIGLSLLDSNTNTIHNNDFENCTSAISFASNSPNNDFVYNSFSGNGICVNVSAGFVSTGNTVNHNFFYENNTLISGGTGNDSVVIIEYNYYHEYFVTFPYAITTNFTMTELQYPWVLSPSRNDTHPLYNPIWYPRNSQVYFRFYSNVDYEGIPFEQLKLYIDSSLTTTQSPIISHVLFRVTIRDYNNTLLYDEILNLNSTGIYINVGLDVAVQIFIKFFSTIDHFGIPFDTVITYIDGVEINHFDPVMRLKILNITITDGYDVVIWSNIVNLSVTGVNIRIFLPIAWITYNNNYLETIVLWVTRGSNLSSYTLGRESNLLMRLAMGVYIFDVYAKNGTLLDHYHTTLNASEPENFVIDFGPVKPDLPVNQTINNSSPLADLLFIGLGFGVAYGSIAALTKYFRFSKKKPGNYRRDH